MIAPKDIKAARFHVQFDQICIIFGGAGLPLGVVEMEPAMGCFLIRKVPGMHLDMRFSFRP